ncbi:MAG: insulinase family protein [Bacteroidota bacterium]|nr:insulinase family protein [Bacteroidota bacterium]MDX5428997.1 insulinase family protein [Bacteroidota bacterium]MDX5448506.1 insulinase family protein [Bacteroidota bacterium]MDX5506661.1 insulinase family protein [Bacteroidota bacterium]
MEFETFTLPNGIRVVHKEVDSPVSHCGIVVNAGSREEREEEQGLAHFMEHTLFKGTAKRKAYHILSRLEDVGGELNAYTSKEETFIYGSFLSPFYNRTIELLSDITFHATFPARELAKEKDVIREEINSFLDSPGEMIFDEFEDLIYKGHSLGRNILGTPDTLKHLGRKDLLSFRDHWYTTDNMVFSSVGNISTKRLQRLLEKHLESIPERSRFAERTPVNGYTAENISAEKDTFQTHAIIGNRAYHADHKNSTALIFLNNLLGGPGSSSRLNLNIREKYGFAYHIESFYTPYTDTGTFGIYVGTDKGTVDRALDLIHKELRKLRERPLGVLQMSKARNQIKGQIAMSQESRINQMIGFGKAKLLFNRIDTLEEVHEKIDRLTADDILEVANEILDPVKLSTLIYKAK